MSGQERREKVGELDGLVALNAVAGALEYDDLRIGTALLQFGDVVVVYDRRQAPARERERHLRATDHLPQVVEAGHDAALLAFAGSAPRQVVTPAPPAVGQLDGVVHDAAPQRRLGAGRVELDGPVEDLV